MFERDRISSCASIIFKTVCRENILVRGLMVDLCRNDCTDRLGMSFSTFLRHFGAGGDSGGGGDVWRGVSVAV